MKDDQKLQPHPQVVDVELEGDETVLLHLDSKTYYSLNSTGARIWNLLKAGKGEAEIVEQLQLEFQVDAARAEASVAALLADLRSHHLLHGAG